MSSSRRANLNFLDTLSERIISARTQQLDNFLRVQASQRQDKQLQMDIMAALQENQMRQAAMTAGQRAVKDAQDQMKAARDKEAADEAKKERQAREKIEQDAQKASYQAHLDNFGTVVPQPVTVAEEKPAEEKPAEEKSSATTPPATPVISPTSFY